MVKVLINYARSGGTLLNRCLGVLPDTIILSEVNPLGIGSGIDKSGNSIKNQLKNWYNIHIAADDFDSALLEISSYCTQQGKNLIIRDWSYVNFHPNKENSFQPPKRFLLLETLHKYNIPFQAFALVRNTYDVWISRGCPVIEEYFAAYESFIEEILKLNIPVFQYEQFCSDPIEEMKKICIEVDLQFDSDFINNFSTFNKVNGDIQSSVNSRGFKSNEIKPLKRKYIHPYKVFIALKHKSEFEKANKSLGYSSDLFDASLALSPSKYIFLTSRKVISKVHDVFT